MCSCSDTDIDPIFLGTSHATVKLHPVFQINFRVGGPGQGRFLRGQTRRASS